MALMSLPSVSFELMSIRSSQCPAAVLAAEVLSRIACQPLSVQLLPVLQLLSEAAVLPLGRMRS